MSRNALPAAVPVSIGCSVALRMLLQSLACFARCEQVHDSQQLPAAAHHERRTLGFGNNWNNLH